METRDYSFPPKPLRYTQNSVKEVYRCYDLSGFVFTYQYFECKDATYGEVVGGVSAQREQPPSVHWHHAL